jgi:hypothetical protein
MQLEELTEALPAAWEEQRKITYSLPFRANDNGKFGLQVTAVGSPLAGGCEAAGAGMKTGRADD